MPYWEEALRRDAGDSRVNTVMGITAYTKAKYTDAEKYLRTAIARLTDKFTTPKDAEAIYYLGATLKARARPTRPTQLLQGDVEPGLESFRLLSLARDRGLARRYDRRSRFVDRSIDSNALNIRAQNLKAAVLRHTGRPKEALQLLATAAHKLDPLDVRSMAESWLASKDPGAAKTLTSTMIDHPQTAQETAAEYLDAGLWKDGTTCSCKWWPRSPIRPRSTPWPTTIWATLRRNWARHRRPPSTTSSP